MPQRQAWIWILIGALSAASAVVLGALGAHAAETGSQARAWIETAQSYQMPHALGLLFIGLLAMQRPGPLLTLSALALFLGSLCFSGGLYLQAFDLLYPGPVIPLGGGLFILGWVALAGHALRALSVAKPKRS